MAGSSIDSLEGKGPEVYFSRMLCKEDNNYKAIRPQTAMGHI